MANANDMGKMWKDAQQFFSSKKNRENMRTGISEYLQQQYDETTMKVCQDCGKPYALRDEKEYIDSNGTGYGKVKCCNGCYQIALEGQRQIEMLRAENIPYSTASTVAYIGSSAGFAVIPQRDIWPEAEPVKKQKKQKLKEVIVKKQPKRRILL